MDRGLKEKGLTLVEVLAGLAIASIITLLVFNNLLGGMNSYKSVNKQISLHDEANYIMTMMVNKIYVASSVSGLEDDGSPTCNTVIMVKDRLGAEATLKFENKKAFINSDQLNQSSFSVTEDSKFCKDPNSQNTVSIKLVIQDNESKKKLELNNKVSYVKVE